MRLVPLTSNETSKNAGLIVRARLRLFAASCFVKLNLRFSYLYFCFCSSARSSA